MSLGVPGKKNFPRRPRSPRCGQIWPDLARSGTSGKIFFFKKKKKFSRSGQIWEAQIWRSGQIWQHPCENDRFFFFFFFFANLRKSDRSFFFFFFFTIVKKKKRSFFFFFFFTIVKKKHFFLHDREGKKKRSFFFPLLLIAGTQQEGARHLRRRGDDTKFLIIGGGSGRFRLSCRDVRLIQTLHHKKIYRNTVHGGSRE